MLKKALILIVLLAVATAAGVNYVPPAQAACFTPHGHATEYWGWVSNSDPNDVWCADPPAISYPGTWTDYYHWQQVGERDIECDGTIDEWGITGDDAYGHSCATFYTVHYSWACDPICD